MSKIHIFVNEVIVKNGRRAINKDKVNELAESIKQIGLLHPITVRADDKGLYTLIAGAHRLEAFKLLGRESIDSKVIMKNDMQTELIEIDENLIRNELHYSEIGELLNRKKEIYEELYPETKVGANNKSNNYGKKIEKTESDFSRNNTTEITSPVKPSFVKDTAEKTGRSETVIKEELQIANKVIPEAKPILKEKSIPKIEAIKLARETPEVQKKIIPIFESGQTKKVEEAKKILDPVDIEYDRRAELVEARSRRIKRVIKVLDWTVITDVTEQGIQEYMEDFPSNHQGFEKDCDRAIEAYQNIKQIYKNLNTIRRVK